MRFAFAFADAFPLRVSSPGALRVILSTGVGVLTDAQLNFLLVINVCHTSANIDIYNQQVMLASFNHFVMVGVAGGDRNHN